MKTTRNILTSFTCFCLFLIQAASPLTCFATEYLSTAENKDCSNIERGATTYYYTPISYSFNNKRGRTYMGTKQYTSSFGTQVGVGPCTITYSYQSAGTYKVYSYVTDIVLIARKTDAMGHDLGTVTFTNNGVTVYEYIPV
ncbi:hypothetical protein [Dubosiella newyorkensis]|uniref:hypothetical protein n=1 Tax=Dubosiella newyorkensis TaxID=1862672 RepID=UPI00272D229D|nr:hypothetical protein [Dubosiella newyorkensis]